MPDYKISKRKMESYKRAEVVAQAFRRQMCAGGRVTHDLVNDTTDSLLDWMDVTGEVKYAKPVRRSRINRRPK